MFDQDGIKEVSFSGLSRLNRTADAFFRGVPFGKAKQIREAMLAGGDIIEVQVDGWKAVHYALGSDAEVLRDLSAGRVPEAWTPLEKTTTEEAVFLAPLDPSAPADVPKFFRENTEKHR